MKDAVRVRCLARRSAASLRPGGRSRTGVAAAGRQRRPVGAPGTPDGARRTPAPRCTPRRARMNDRAKPTSADPTRARSQGDRDLVRCCAGRRSHRRDHGRHLARTRSEEHRPSRVHPATRRIRNRPRQLHRSWRKQEHFGYRLATVPEPDRPAGLHEVGGDIAPDATDAGAVRSATPTSPLPKQ